MCNIFIHLYYYEITLIMMIIMRICIPLFYNSIAYISINNYMHVCSMTKIN